MRHILKRLMVGLTVGFAASLGYSLWGRPYLNPGVKQYLDPIAFGLITGFVAVLAVWVFHHHFRYRDIEMAQVDAMDGETFEHFCAYLLKRNGYRHIDVTQFAGDQGVDITATKKGVSYAFQCKRYAGQVGNKAIQEIWAGHNFYKLDQAVVLTNSTFSDSAIELANDLGVTLMDGDQLRRLMRRLPS